MGGAGCTWTETSTVYNSSTQSHETVSTTQTRHAGSPGATGPSGWSGRDGLRGRDGMAGAIHYIVSKAQSSTLQPRILTVYHSLYNLRLQNVHFSGMGSGIIEPGQVITLHDFFVDNNGGMESPPHVEITFDPTSPGHSCFQLLIPSFHTNTSIPTGSLTTLITTSIDQCLQFKILDHTACIVQDNRLLLIDTYFSLQANLYRTGYIFPLFSSLIPSYPMRIEYPIELSMIAGNRSGLFNSKILWSVAITNKSSYPLGNHNLIGDNSKNRIVQLRIDLVSNEKTSMAITTENFLFHVLSPDQQSYHIYPLTMQQPVVINVSSIGPLQQAIFQGFFTLADQTIPLYASLNLQFSLFLGDIADPMNYPKAVCIQREFYSVQMTEVRKYQPYSTDMILVINSDNTREEILYWIEIIQALGHSVNVWNVSLYNGISYDQPSYSLMRHCPDCTVIFLNNPFVVPNSSEAHQTFSSLNYLDPAEIFEAARRYGLRTYLVNAGGKHNTASYRADGDGSDLLQQLFQRSIPLRPSPFAGSINPPVSPAGTASTSRSSTAAGTTEDDTTIGEDEDETSTPTSIQETEEVKEIVHAEAARGSMSLHAITALGDVPVADNQDPANAKKKSKSKWFSKKISMTTNEQGQEIFDGRSDFLKSLLKRDRLRYLRDEKLLPNHPTAYQYILLKYYHVFTIPKEHKFHDRASEFLDMLTNYRPDRAYFIKKNYSGAKKTKGTIFKRYDCGDIEVRRGLDHTYAMIASRGKIDKLTIEGSELDLLSQQRQIDMFVVLKLFPLHKKFTMLSQLLNQQLHSPTKPKYQVMTDNGDGSSTFTEEPVLPVSEQQLLDVIISDIMDELDVHFSHINKIRLPWETYNSKVIAKDIFTSLTALSTFATQSPTLSERTVPLAEEENVSMKRKGELVQQILIRVGLINRLYYKTNFIGNALTPQLLELLVELYAINCHFSTKKNSRDTTGAKKILNKLIDEEYQRIKTEYFPERVNDKEKKVSVDEVMALYQDPFKFQFRSRHMHVYFNHWVAYNRQALVDNYIIAHNEYKNNPSTLSHLKSSLDDLFMDGPVLAERLALNTGSIRYHQKPPMPDMSYLATSDRKPVILTDPQPSVWQIL